MIVGSNRNNIIGRPLGWWHLNHVSSLCGFDCLNERHLLRQIELLDIWQDNLPVFRAKRAQIGRKWDKDERGTKEQKLKRNPPFV